jgi:hypothetical protein
MREEKLYPYRGELKTIKELASLKGIGYESFRKKLKRVGGDVETAMAEAIRPKKASEVYQGKNLSQWETFFALGKNVFRRWVKDYGFEKAKSLGMKHVAEEGKSDAGLKLIPTECRCPKCGRTYTRKLIPGADRRRYCPPCAEMVKSRSSSCQELPKAAWPCVPE